MRATGRLRELLARKTPLVAPGCYKALTARVLDRESKRGLRWRRGHAS
jgi:2-methylisocitrate lyase-like PEP mutase family enzyme